MAMSVSTIQVSVIEAESKLFLFIEEGENKYRLPKTDDIKSCFCTGCALIFPFLPIIKDLEALAGAQEQVLIRATSLHNDHVQKKNA